MELLHSNISCSSQLLNTRVRVLQTPLLLNHHCFSTTRNYHNKLTSMDAHKPLNHASSSPVLLENNNASSTTGNWVQLSWINYAYCLSSCWICVDKCVILWFLGECRVGEVKRVTKETNVAVRINLDGSGVADSCTGIPFLDHMLDVSI